MPTGRAMRREPGDERLDCARFDHPTIVKDDVARVVIFAEIPRPFGYRSGDQRCGLRLRSEIVDG